MGRVTEMLLKDCRGPLQPLTISLPAAGRPLSLWRTPTPHGTLDPAAFERAHAWAMRSPQKAEAAIDSGRKLREMLAFCALSASCTTSAITRDDLAADRILLLATTGGTEEDRSRYRNLIRILAARSPDTRIYVHSGQACLASGFGPHDGVEPLPLELDPGQLAHLFDKAATVDSPVGILLQCCGLTVTAEVPDALLPDDTREACLWLHLLFEKLAIHFDPATNLPAPAFDIARLVTDRLRQHRVNRTVAVFTGIHAWKKTTTAAMFGSAETRPDVRDFVWRAPEKAQKKKRAFAAWASSLDEATVERCRVLGVPLFRIEDGFIRSAGLGAAGFRSLSFVLDDMGIHYDARQPSRLEHILQTGVFDDALRARANRIIGALVDGELTKYNLAEADTALPVPSDQRVIFVPGQVDDDASLKYGGAGMNGRMLLTATRELNPDAFIIYKPHPDVLNGLRNGFSDRGAALELADLFVEHHSPLSLIALADEVHTISSLTGFEALLRGRKVVCHGQPFYSGWGLTEDLRPLARRTRKLTVSELVAGTLILYPHYLDPLTGTNTSPEIVMERILSHKRNPPPPALAMRARWLIRRWLRQLSGYMPSQAGPGAQSSELNRGGRRS